MGSGDHGGVVAPETMTSALAELARSGRLPLPGRPDFDAEGWQRAAADAPDDPLLASVLWFDAELRSVRDRIAALRIGRFERDRMVAELCGRCNYAYAYSEAALRGMMEKAEPGSLPMGSPAHLLFHTESGDVGNADAFRTSATDTLGAALRDVFANSRPDRGTPFGAAGLALDAYSTFTRLYVLEFYSEKVIWQDWRVVDEGDALRFTPPDPDPFGVSSIAADWRRDQEHGEYLLVGDAAWSEGRGWPEPVAHRVVEGTRVRYEVRNALPGDGAIPSGNVLRWQIEASDLADVWEERLPHFGETAITLADLIDAFLLWRSAAAALLDDALATLPDARSRSYAGTMARDDLVGMCRAIGWRREKAEAVLDFFTFAGRAMDGVWSKPFVLAGVSKLIPVFSALIGPNLYRSAEIWLAEAGGERIQRSRGLKFEDRVRRGLQDAVRGGALRGRVNVATPWTVKIDGARRDVDLAIRIDKTVFVADTKLKRFPASPREAARWSAELRKGAGQARLRTRFLAKDPQSAAQATAYGGRATDLTFEPFVLASGYFGTGVMVEGVPVIDLDGLIEFFGPGYYGALGELGPGSEMHPVLTVPFCREGDDLGTCFAAYLREPVRIRAVERAMVPLARSVGVRAGDGRPILCTERMVDHLRFTDPNALHREVDAHWRGVRREAGLDAT